MPQTTASRDCPYGERIGEDHVRCAKFSKLCGFTCTVLVSTCKAHFEAGGPEVPIMKVPELRRVARGLMLARLFGGDAPRYQKANPVDLKAVARKLKSRLAPHQRRWFLRRIVRKWAELPETKGGHPVDVLVERARELAREWECEDELRNI